jgi:protein-arginine kinase activator protein McsA
MHELTVCNNCGEIFKDQHGTSVYLKFDTDDFKDIVRDLKLMHEPDDEDDIFLGCPNCATDGNLQDNFIDTFHCNQCDLDFYRPYRVVTMEMPHKLGAISKVTDKLYELENLYDKDTEVFNCPHCGKEIERTFLLTVE